MPGSISWPFGTRYSVARKEGASVTVTNRPRWPWSKPRQWHLVRKSDNWFWEHTGQPLTLAPQHAWLALNAALEGTD